MGDIGVRAVVFDLFGTLVPNFPSIRYAGVMREMAAVLSAREEEFGRLYSETYPLRLTGELSTTEANVRRVCALLGVQPSARAVADAARLRVELTRDLLLSPLPGAVETLIRLKTMRVGVGLISDCSAEVPLVWPETQLAPLIDAPVFSCSVRLRKPDPRIYGLACERLGVEHGGCIYIGDGSGRELTGALAAGMRAVLIRVAFEDTVDVHRPEVLEWRGPEVAHLSDVPALVARLRSDNSGGRRERPDRRERGVS